MEGHVYDKMLTENTQTADTASETNEPPSAVTAITQAADDQVGCSESALSVTCEGFCWGGNSAMELTMM